jgi:hypothetical protein
VQILDPERDFYRVIKKFVRVFQIKKKNMKAANKYYEIWRVFSKFSLVFKNLYGIKKLLNGNKWYGIKFIGLSNGV